MIRPMALALETTSDGVVAKSFFAETQFREPRIPGREGRNAVEIILAIYRSAKERKAIRLS